MSIGSDKVVAVILKITQKLTEMKKKLEDCEKSNHKSITNLKNMFQRHK
jgi:hypothetical protein